MGQQSFSDSAFVKQLLHRFMASLGVGIEKSERAAKGGRGDPFVGVGCF
jgi:hypothetical protein